MCNMQDQYDNDCSEFVNLLCSELRPECKRNYFNPIALRMAKTLLTPII